MILKFLLLIIFISPFQVFGQKDPRRTKIEILYDSAWKMKGINTDKAFQLLHQMDTIALYSKDPRDDIQVLEIRAWLNNPHNVLNGLASIRQAIALANAKAIHQYDRRLFYVAGGLFKHTNLDSANYYLETSYHLARLSKDSVVMSNALNTMAFIAMDQGDFIKALKYLQTCEKYFFGKQPAKMVTSKLNQSHALSAVGLEDRAIELAKQGIEQALQEHYKGYENQLISLYGNLIESLLKLNKPLEAYRYWRKMMVEIPHVHDLPEYSHFTLTIGEIYLALDSPALALSALTKNVPNPKFGSYRRNAGIFYAYGQLGDRKNQREMAQELIRKIPKVKSVDGSMNTFKIAEQAFEFLQMNDSAYHYHKLYFESYQLLYSQRQLGEILQDEFNAKLVLEQSEAAMERKILESEIRYNKQRFLFVVAVTVLLAFIVGLLIIRYRSARRFNSLLNQRVEERTQELFEKNKQLSEYAFINAHKLRAPVARILGLLNLPLDERQGAEPSALMAMLRAESESLDNIVRSITKAIEDKRMFDRNDIRM
ncbi:hypothetical protein [Chryseolinea lacunae]|uniref:Signal transduction histidine kinase dimerisation/phosphoacceptor domain-containing protein n=1 Tax=Chryseolinea lacunae TaxID=2801331 RepID=A0ABS1L2S6_9BACT|nr:hypothetical protein [Chryseolinea lacunae]MBL0745753.1 hypothetical protein [Chryseolinea lacunae]